VKDAKPIVVQLYCRLEVVIDDPGAVLDLAAHRLREADIDWASEQDTLAEAVDEMRGDLAESLASLMDPDGLLAGVPGVEVRRGRYWAEAGPPSERFAPR
jgi:hypothetical protein